MTANASPLRTAHGLEEALAPPRRTLTVVLGRSLLLAVALALAACSSLKPWINQPLTANAQVAELRKVQLQQTAARDPSMLVAVTLMALKACPSSSKVSCARIFRTA